MCHSKNRGEVETREWPRTGRKREGTGFYGPGREPEERPRRNAGQREGREREERSLHAAGMRAYVHVCVRGGSERKRRRKWEVVIDGQIRKGWRSETVDATREGEEERAGKKERRIKLNRPRAKDFESHDDDRLESVRRDFKYHTAGRVRACPRAERSSTDACALRPLSNFTATRLSLYQNRPERSLSLFISRPPFGPRCAGICHAVSDSALFTHTHTLGKEKTPKVHACVCNTFLESTIFSSMPIGDRTGAFRMRRRQQDNWVFLDDRFKRILPPDPLKTCSRHASANGSITGAITETFWSPRIATIRTYYFISVETVAFFSQV